MIEKKQPEKGNKKAYYTILTYSVSEHLTGVRVGKKKGP